MAFYEHVFLMRQDLSASQVEDISKKIKDIIEADQGKVTKIEQWDLMNLAYKVKKNKKAYFTLMNLDVSPETLKKVQQSMSVNENILRFLTIKVDELDNNPSPVLNEIKGHNDHSDSQNDDDVLIEKNVNYKNVEYIKRFITERGKILPRRLTMSDSQGQRKIAQAIKRLRFLALISPLYK